MSQKVIDASLLGRPVAKGNVRSVHAEEVLWQCAELVECTFTWLYVSTSQFRLCSLHNYFEAETRSYSSVPWLNISNAEWTLNF